jgi:GNAT superfamily N-acetyltransferase
MTVPPVIATRPAEAADLDLLEEIHGIAVASVLTQRGGELDQLLRGRPEPVRDSFDIELARAESLVILGTIDDEPVGYGVVRVVDLPNGDRLAQVVDLFVLEPGRGVGVGEALLDAIIAFGVDRGCRGIDARALPGDRTTKNFFESFGLVARSIEVYSDLD